MSKLLRRLRSKRGESLLESLVSILLFTIGSMIMFSMCMAATNTNRTVKEKSKWMETQLVTVEKAVLPADDTGEIKMKFSYPTRSDPIVVDSNVNVFGQVSSDSLYTYFKQP